MTDRFYCVYMHVIPKEISGYVYDKRYIGITCRNPKERWGRNGENYNRQYFYNAIKKYGWENIEHVILCSGLTLEEASKKEKELINKYESKLGFKGYNASDGGEKYNLTGKNTYHPVYCIETRVAYKNATIAAQMTGENYETLQTKLSDTRWRSLRKGYHWCRINDIYKYIKHAHSNYKPVVYLLDHKTYGNLSVFNKKFNTKLKGKNVLNLEKYIKLVDKGKDVSCRVIWLEDYLKIFDFTL